MILMSGAEYGRVLSGPGRQIESWPDDNTQRPDASRKEFHHHQMKDDEMEPRCVGQGVESGRADKTTRMTANKSGRLKGVVIVGRARADWILGIVPFTIACVRGPRAWPVKLGLV